MCSAKILLLMFLYTFIFLTAAHFHRSPSLLFSITLSSTFSGIHVSVDIKNNIEKDSTLLFFSFLSLLTSGWPCDFPPKKTSSCTWVAIPVDWVILHWYACGVDGRAGVRSRDYPNFLDA